MILAGGLGTRMGDALGGLPKALAPMAGRPFVEHLIRFLARHGVRDVVLCTGAGAEQVAAALGDGRSLGVRLAYAREEEPLGTGGAIRNAAPLVDGPRWLVLNGDSLVDVSPDALVDHHLGHRARATLALAGVPDTSRYGAVRLAADSAVVEFTEKRASDVAGGLVNAGMCVLERDVLDLIPAHGACSLERDVFPRLTGAGLFGLATGGGFVDIGTAEAYLAVRDAPGELLRIAG